VLAESLLAQPDPDATGAEEHLGRALAVMNEIGALAHERRLHELGSAAAQSAAH
jgi:hypothetical protein